MVEDCHAGDHGGYGGFTAGMKGSVVSYLLGFEKITEMTMDRNDD